MPVDYLQAVIPILGLIINVSVQVISFRNLSLPSFGLLKSIILGFIVGFILVLFLGLYFLLNTQDNQFLFSLIVNIISYISLGYCYFHFVNLGETARRIRILTELYGPMDGLTKEEILQRYDAKYILDRRLDRLIANNQVILIDGRYYIKGQPFMLTISRIITALKYILLGKRSEFD